MRSLFLSPYLVVYIDKANTMEMQPFVDLERKAVGEAHLLNRVVDNISWRGVTITVKDREAKQPKRIVDNVEGVVKAGNDTLRP